MGAVTLQRQKRSGDPGHASETYIGIGYQIERLILKDSYRGSGRQIKALAQDIQLNQKVGSEHPYINAHHS